MTRILQFTETAATRELESMLRWRRPAGSKTERRWTREFIDSIPGVAPDAYGNRILKIGDSPILWSSHTDSVHCLGGQQHVVRDGALIRLAPDEKQSNCLGADCATGAWLMRQMALRGVAGLYVWHKDEEIGGHGSRWIAKNAPRLFDGIGFAIALDRRGVDSIITHQGERCASDDFARSVMPMLPASFMPDPTGLFTDTAHYVDRVGECSNLSIGYAQAHSPAETQEVPFALELLEALCALDASRLVASRAPGERDAAGWGWRDSWLARDPWESTRGGAYNGADNYERLLELIRANPSLVADWLDMGGVDAGELARELGVDDGESFDN